LWNLKVHYHVHMGLPPIHMLSYMNPIHNLQKKFCTCFMACPSHTPWFHHPNNVWWKVQIMSSSICNFLHAPVLPFSVSPNMLLTTLFFPYCERPGFPHMQNNRQNYSVVCFSLTFSDSKWEDKRFWNAWQQALPEFSLLLISSWMHFWFINIIIPKYLNFTTFSKDLLATCI
jgi:hypothetical protein